MKVLSKMISEINSHQYARIDSKYWITQEEVAFSKYRLLSEMFEIINGSVQTSHYTDEVTGFPYIRISNIDYKYGINTEDVIYLDSICDVKEERILKKDDLILATIGATVGKIGMAKCCEGGTCSNNTVILRAKDKRTNIAFFERLFQTDFYINYIFGVVSQKAQPNLQSYDLENIRVPIISKQTIEKSLNGIKPLEKRILELKSSLQTTQEIIDSVFSLEFKIDVEKQLRIDAKKKMQVSFSSFDQNNPNIRFSYRWNKSMAIQEEIIASVDCCKKLGRYIIATQNGWSPDCDETQSALRVLGIDSIKKDGTISFENVKYSNETKKNIDSYIIKNGDFFVSRGNTTELVALAAVASVGNDDTITIFPDLMIRIDFDDRVHKEYMAYVFNSIIGRLYFKYVTKGKNQTMVKVSPQELNDFYVPLPDYNEQQRIVENIQSEIAKQNEIKTQIAELRDQIDSIIEEAITKGDE